MADAQDRRARPLLLTAFEPFGTPTRPDRGTNASEEVLLLWRERHPGIHRTLILPVSRRAETILARALTADVAGVIATGEAGIDGAWDTNIEPWAEDRPIASPGISPPGQETPLRLHSAFAPTVELVPGLEREPRIGAYWCNRVYFRILDWARWNPRPVVFLHLRVDGDRSRQRTHLEHVVAAMEGTIR